MGLQLHRPCGISAKRALLPVCVAATKAIPLRFAHAFSKLLYNRLARGALGRHASRQAQEQRAQHSHSHRHPPQRSSRVAATTRAAHTDFLHGQRNAKQPAQLPQPPQKHTGRKTNTQQQQQKKHVTENGRGLFWGRTAFFFLSVSVLTCVTNATHRAVTFPIGHPLREGSSAKEHRRNTQARRKKSKRKETYTRPTDAHTQAQSLRMKRQGCCHGVLALGKQL